MRHGRAKASRRTLQFYRLNASHFSSNKNASSPSSYKILLDGTFLVASIRNKVPLRERFGKTLQHESFACYVTRSTLIELEKLSEQASKKGIDDQDNFLARARQYGLDECEIIEDDEVPSSTKNGGKRSKAFKDFSQASTDIYDLATEGGINRRAYFVATQDDALADALRSMPYVPLFRLGRAVLLLESPSSASRNYTGNAERAKLSSAGGLMTEEERKMVDTVKKKDKRKRKEMMEEERKKLERRSRDEIGGGFNNRKKKRAKGPNPLSCKGKKR